MSLFLIFVEYSFAITQTEIVSGLQGVIGIALDEVNNQLYFVEYGSGELNKIDLSSGSPLDIVHGLAYVIPRDAPGTGALWKIDINSGSKTLVTFNLGAPQQLFLDVANNQVLRLYLIMEY